MFYRILLLLFLFPSLAEAQQAPRYQNTSLDEIFENLSGVISHLQPGLTMMPQQKVHFFARYAGSPSSCDATDLQFIFKTFGMAEAYKQVSISHCIKLATKSGHLTSAFIQDILMKGLLADVKLNDQIEIYADLWGFRIYRPEEQSTPILLINRFEPVDPKPEHG